MTVPDYATTAMVKAVMPDVSWGTEYDFILGTLITRASRLIDRATLRESGEFCTGTAGTVRYFDGSGEQRLWIDELADVPSLVEVAETGDLTAWETWAATDYILWPYNSPPYRRLDVDVLYGTKAIWPKFRKAVRITGPWGFSVTVPDDLQQAVITQVVRWFKRGQQSFSDVGAVAELGQLTYTKAIDPDVAMMIEFFRRVVV